MTSILVQTTIVVMTTQSLAHVKAQLSKIVDDAVSTQDHIVITRNGAPAAVLMSFEEHERMIDTLDILNDPETMASLRQSATETSVVLTKHDMLMQIKAANA